MRKASRVWRRKFLSSEGKILEAIDRIMNRKSVRTAIDSIAFRVEGELKRDTLASLVWEPVPLSVYHEGLPEQIRSSWVFAVRSRTNTGTESHPNSHQRMMSYRGAGDLQIWDAGKWCSNFLSSSQHEQIDSRWVSIPPGVLHRAVASEENWIVVSFHTAPEDDLVEERPDPNNPGLKIQRRYLD